MKKFVLKADLLAGMTHTLNLLTPEQKGKAGNDAVEGNRLILKAISDCEEANSVFMEATKETGDKLKTLFETKKAEADKEAGGKTPEETQKILALKTNEYRKEADVIQKESKAQPETMVDVQLSDDKFQAVSKVFSSTVGSWQDSVAFVSVADALEAAQEA